MDEYEAERLLELTNEICDRLPAVIAERNELRARVHTLANQAQNQALKIDRLEREIAALRLRIDAGQTAPCDTISDGHGNVWQRFCLCGAELQIVRPGYARCPVCDDPQGDVLPSETVTQLAASYAGEHADLRAKLEAAANKRLERDDKACRCELSRQHHAEARRMQRAAKGA